MKEEWKKVKLGELCEITSSKRFHLSERTTLGIPFYCTKEILLKLKGEENFECDYIAEKFYEEIKTKFGVPETGDLLLTTRGTVGYPYLYRKTDKFYFADGNLSWFKNFSEKLDSHFLYYWFLSVDGKSKVDSIAKGTAQKAVPITGLGILDITLPPLPTQQKIASILSAYDDLIENNRKQIKLLEEAAQKLYKEWFVKLNFPGHENTKIVDGIPEGWSYERIDSFVELQNGFAFKSDSFDEDGTYKIITIKNVQDGIFDSNNVSKIKQIPQKMPKWCNLKSGDILLSLTGNVGRVCLVTSENCLLNQRVAKLKSDYPSYTYILFRSKDMFIMMNNLANGAAQQNLSPIRTGEQKILKPSKEVINSFERISKPYIKKIQMLFKQNETLQIARDKLLPKLMNGEIEV